MTTAGGGGGGGAVTATVVAVVDVAVTVLTPMAKFLNDWKVLSPDVGGLIAKTIPI